jgi:hypothetical protein
MSDNTMPPITPADCMPIDHWRQRAEAAEAGREKWRNLAKMHACRNPEELMAYIANLHHESDGRGGFAEDLQELRQDRDRLSRALDEASAVLGYVSAAMVAAREKLAVAVKALESIAAESYNDSAQDKARRALEAISNKESNDVR